METQFLGEAENETEEFIEYDPYSPNPDPDLKESTAPDKIAVYDYDKITEFVSDLRCKLCDFVGSSIREILLHYEHHRKEQESENTADKNRKGADILICGLCYCYYETINILREHMIKDHGCTENNPREEETPGTNLQSDKVNLSEYVSESEVEEEELTLAPLPFKNFKIFLKQSLIQKCPMKGCCYKFENKEKQEKHTKCHISDKPEDVKNFKCLECSKESKSWRECAKHMWGSHKINLDLLSCPLCSFKGICSIKVWRHMKSHPKWKSKVIKSSSHWNVPKTRLNNSITTRWYSQKTCEICSRQFANSKTLSKHVKTVHNKIKPFICNICGRKSARKSTWVIHMRQHTGEKPFQCKTCPYRASDPSVLKAHEKRHTKETPYRCESCDYSSIQPTSLKLHVKKHHPEDYKKLQCDQCNYVSVSPGLLEFHRKDHKKGLICNEDSQDASRITPMKAPQKYKQSDTRVSNVEISSDCFLPLESTDSIAPDLTAIDTGGVTIPAHSEDTQFPNFISH